MRLSEPIRLGAMATPRAVGTLFSEDKRVRLARGASVPGPVEAEGAVMPQVPIARHEAGPSFRSSLSPSQDLHLSEKESDKKIGS